MLVKVLERVLVYTEKVNADLKQAAGCLLFSHASSIFLEMAMLVSLLVLLVSRSTTFRFRQKYLSNWMDCQEAYK